MKKIGEYTVRGQITEAASEAGSPFEITLFDGRFDTGYRIKEFYAWGANISSSSAPDVTAKLCTSANCTTSATAFLNAQDQREIAWAGSAGSTDTVFNAPMGGVIDPDNMVVEDLYIYARSSAETEVNYMIVMEKYDITDWQGALIMAKDRAADTDGI
jgi:hypothetical protein